MILLTILIRFDLLNQLSMFQHYFKFYLIMIINQNINQSIDNN